MKKVLLLMVAVLMVSSVAMADHIGIYADNTGASCSLNVAGFSTTPTVIHKFSTGATASRWYIDSSLGGGASILAFTTSYTTVGDIHNDLSVGYGNCFTGSIVLGTLVMTGGAPGQLDVKTAIGQTNIIYTDCSFGEHQATGGTAYINSTGNCHEVATENSTWGQVKALYR
jgi:hypothetical protein